ncbi:ABC transporter ATP-binding protein [Marinicella litoralis]|uniref:Iron complex transport system ATP-binding protein n=1 Tax=Marinicella litoralis TaxID=644220 RepID=A0A4R6XZB6_9GAMM|nr:ABC transporter ATP-binding protein [Marinicella litoralis]TDR23637.1 iron complex transport system ATP-binding protein [Marinicella litoralis]
MISLKKASIFQESAVLIRNLDVEFNPGEFWGIIGKNGVGKSTLLNVLAGMSNHYEGEIQIDGQPLNQINHRVRAQKISYLLQEQEPCLAFLVEEAIGMGRFPWLTTKSEDIDITGEVMNQCQINHLQGRSILKLSGGERRKVEIGTCLAQQSGHLLLDEPLNHLDVVYQKHIMQVFKQYSQRNAVIMVCHDIEAVKKYCSHVLMLLGNDCYLSGTSATILTETNLNKLFDDSSQLN